jgi:hypothetical protein
MDTRNKALKRLGGEYGNFISHGIPPKILG